MNLKLPTHLVISLKMLYVHLVSKQTNILGRIMIIKNPVEIAIKKFEHHPSINLTNKNITNNETFHFSPADHAEHFKRNY